MKIFDENELYDLLNAEHNAQSFEEETGCGASLFDYADETEYNDKLSKINEENFFEQLSQWAIELKYDFNELGELNENDFDTEEEFWENRNELQDNIIDFIRCNCNEYLI